MLTDAEVTRVDADGTTAEVVYRHGDTEHVVGARHVLAGVAPRCWTACAAVNRQPRPSARSSR
ncbi:hypothetical protein ACFQV2_08265 [Actinokineospora soli]|uniref:Uncharacterized protein n=1 Tax=Actinokineospora soli TaxID=1048753 RepID=A0ABW2TIM0_9PSEU